MMLIALIRIQVQMSMFIYFPRRTSSEKNNIFSEEIINFLLIWRNKKEIIRKKTRKRNKKVSPYLKGELSNKFSSLRSCEYTC